MPQVRWYNLRSENDLKHGWTKRDRINKILNGTETGKAIKPNKAMSKQQKDHIVEDAVENEYALVKTANGVVILETPDAIYDLE